MVRVDNFTLRYSNCWEDADLLTNKLAPASGKKFCSVASGGENSLSLLILNPELLLIVDVNPIQLYLTELKATVIQYLDYEDCLSFLGYTHSLQDRKTVYQKLKMNLSSDCRNFWDKNINKLTDGVIHSGSSEGKFQFFAKYIRPCFHSTAETEQLMAVKSAQAQEQFYLETWNNKRWKAIFKIFFSRFIMRKMAPDPDFLNFFKGNISTYLYDKTAMHLSSTDCQTNAILHYILFGHYGNLLPHFIKKENFTIIKSNLKAIKYYKGFAEEPATQYGKFDAFNLSNIFEYTLPQEFNQIGHKLNASGQADALYIYWNILVHRQLSNIPNIKMINLLNTMESPIADKGWHYSSCILDKNNF